LTDEYLTRSCYTGPAGTQGVGICHAGTQICSAGDWGVCAGEQIPQTEVCDNLDNDCDGEIDDHDKIPPVTTDDTPLDWQSSGVTVTLTAADSGCGVKEIRYSLNGEEWITAAGSSADVLVSDEGINTIEYYAVDNSGFNGGNVETTKSAQVKIDKTPPSAPSLAVLPTWSTTGNVSLSWSVSTDALSGFDYYEVWRKTDVAAYAKVSNGLTVLSFTDTGLATDTKYYYKIRAYDIAGNYIESADQSITIDTVYPTVQVTAPLNDQIFNVDTVTVYVDYANTYSVNCQAQLDSGTWHNMAGDNLISGTATYTFGGIAEGKHNFTAKCWDEAGNTQYDEALDVVIDTINPITTSSFISAEWQKADISITLTCSDPAPGSGCDKTYYCIDTTECTPTTEYTGTITHSTEGIYYIRFRSTDIAGNVETIKSQILKLDKTVPTISITAPDSPTDETPGEFTWSITDALSDVASAQISLDLLQISTALTGSIAIPNSLGGHTLDITATDVAGNLATDSESVTILDDDATAPIITVTYAGSNLDSDAGTWTITLSDPESAATATYNLDNSSAVSINEGTTIVNVPNSLGSHTITVDATNNDNDRPGDEETSTASDSQSISDDDTTAPAITNVQVKSIWTPNTYTKDTDTVTITATITDLESGIGAVSVDGSNLGSASNIPMLNIGGSTYQATLIVSTAGDNGIKSITIYATNNDDDRPGDEETSSAQGSITVDNTPTVTSLTLTGTQGKNDWYTTDVTATVSATDNLAGVADSYICSNQANDCIPALGDSIVIATENDNYIKYYSTDNVNNIEQTHTQLVNLDKTNPIVSITPLPQFDGDGIVQIIWSGSDAISGIDYYELYRNNALILTTTNTSYTDEGLSDAATYAYYVKAYDNAGRSASSATTSVTIDLLPPTVPDMYPLPQYTTTSNVYIDWNESTDVVSGVNHYTLYKDALAGINTGLNTYHDDNSVSEGLAYTYQATATDNVGHESVKSDPASTTIDTLAPVTSHSIAGTIGDNGWYKEEIIGVTLASIDATSGVKETYYKIDTGSYQSYTGTFTLSDGIYTIYYYSVDIAGNEESEKNFTVKVDTQPPATTDNAPAGWQNIDVTVTLTPTDNLADIAETYYCKDTAGTCTPAIPGTSVLIDTESAENYIRYYSVDNAGNNEQIRTAGPIMLDKTAPITADDNIYNDIWVNFNDVTITLTATDNLAEVKQTDYSINGVPYTSLTEITNLTFFADDL